MEKKMRIGELASKYNIDVRTIDFYTKKAEILTAKTYPGSSYRDYDEESEKQLLKILILRDIGLSIEEIKTALKDPSYFTHSKLEEQITQLKRNKEAAEKKYDKMISFAQDLLLTNSAPQVLTLSYYPWFHENNYQLNPFELMKSSIHFARKIKDSIYNESSSEDIEEFTNLFVALFFNLKRKREFGFSSAEIQNTINRFISKLSDYLGIILYLYSSLVIEALSDEYILSADREYNGDKFDSADIEIIKKILIVFAPWFRSEKTKENIFNFDKFRHNYASQLSELDALLHNSNYTSDNNFSFYDEIITLVQECIEYIISNHYFFEYIIIEFQENPDFIQFFDQKYGVNFLKFVTDAFLFNFNNAT